MSQSSWLQPSWHQGPVSWKTIFSMDQGSVGEGFGMTQEHYIHWALYFYYYCISSTSNHSALDPRGWGKSESDGVSVMHDSFTTWQPTRLLCPWKSPGKKTGVGCHSLLQGIFLTQELNPDLLDPCSKASQLHDDKTEAGSRVPTLTSEGLSHKLLPPCQCLE